MQIQLGGITFDGTSNPRAVYTIDGDGLRGIFDAVGVRRHEVVRPNAHGSFPLPGYREARYISIRGLLKASSQFDFENRMNELASVLADGGTGTLTVFSDLGSRRAQVELADGVNMKVLVPGRLAEFQLLLRAPDPRLLGDPNEFAGSSVQVFHRGNFPASPVIEVEGPITGPYTITGPGGRSVTVAQSLTAGQTHRFDMATGYLYRGSARQIGQITHWKPWTIPANQRVSMSINKGSMIVKVTDTYM